jgi:hypothetical protein
MDIKANPLTKSSPTIFGKTYDYGYNGPNAPETIHVQLDLDGENYYGELVVYGYGKTTEQADVLAKNGESRLIEELRKIVENYDRTHYIKGSDVRLESSEDYFVNEKGELVKK